MTLKTGVNDAGNPALHHRNKLHFKILKIKCNCFYNINVLL